MVADEERDGFWRWVVAMLEIPRRPRQLYFKKVREQETRIRERAGELSVRTTRVRLVELIVGGGLREVTAGIPTFVADEVRVKWLRVVGKLAVKF